MEFGMVELNAVFLFQLFNTLLLLAFFIIVFLGVPYYMMKKLKNAKEVNKRLVAIEMAIEQLKKENDN